MRLAENSRFWNFLTSDFKKFSLHPLPYGEEEWEGEILSFVFIFNLNARLFQVLTTSYTDMRFVKKFTPPDFQAKDFTSVISLTFNSFCDKNTKVSVFSRYLHYWQNFTLPAAVTAVTNLTSDHI